MPHFIEISCTTGAIRRNVQVFCIDQFQPEFTLGNNFTIAFSTRFHKDAFNQTGVVALLLKLTDYLLLRSAYKKWAKMA
jgi:hypothetical protein